MRKSVSTFIESVKLVELSVGYRLSDFKCSIDEYSRFLVEDALVFQDAEVSKTHLLINKSNADIIAYMTLVTDSIRLSNSEREEHEVDSISFGSFPAMKIGKLAVDSNYAQQYKGIGSFLIELARGIAHGIIETGVACRFITVDADIENDPGVVEFYIKNGFKPNTSYKKRDTALSMRLDLFHD